MDKNNSPMRQPGWWVQVATELPMEFLGVVLQHAYESEIITPEIAGDIRKMAQEMIEGYAS